MRQKLLSLTQKDFKFDFYRGSGAGGQKRNKTSSACRCTHVASKAVAQCEDHREQRRNKLTAFHRCVAKAKFKKWLRIEIAKVSGEYAEIECAIDDQMKPEFLKTEVWTNGEWTITWT